MSKSPLISIEAGEMTPHQFKRKAQMNVTFEELGEELRSLAKSVLDAFGPIAIMQQELMTRQQALEDAMCAMGPEFAQAVAREIAKTIPRTTHPDWERCTAPECSVTEPHEHPTTARLRQPIPAPEWMRLVTL